MKIYELRANFYFSQFYRKGNVSFNQDTLHWNDNLKQKSYFYDIESSLEGRKNFKFDISLQTNHLILSDNACDFFEKYGTFFDIETKSKRKKFNGFFPNKCVIDSSYLNLKTSDCSVLENGNIYWRRVCFNEEIKNLKLDLFVVDSVLLTIYVTDTFKEIIERNKLVGLDFYLVYDSNLSIDWKFQVIKKHLNNSEYSDVIRKVYKFYANVEDFDDFVRDKELVDEQPFLGLYKKYQSQISTVSKKYPLITEYQVLCVLDKDLREFISYLREFNNFLIENNIFLKSKYIDRYVSRNRLF